MLGEKNYGFVHKAEKVEVKSRDVCVVIVSFLFLDEPH